MKILLAFICGLALCFCAAKVYGAKTTPEHYDKMSEHLDNVNRMASSLEHFEEFEAYEAEMFEAEYLQEVEHFRKKGLPQASAKSAAFNKLAGKHGPKFGSAIQRKQSAGAGRVGANPFMDAAAQFDITVTRDTANINMALTVPMFGVMHYNAKYLSIMGQFLPNGVIIDTITVNAAGSVVFTMKNTVNNLTDTITISCTQIPYITFLTASNYNAFRLAKVRYAISDVTRLTQFNQPFEVYSKTIFGKHGGNGISLAAANDPKFLNSGVRDVDNTLDVDNSTAVVIGIINVPLFSVTLSAFVSSYNRISTNG